MSSNSEQNNSPEYDSNEIFSPYTAEQSNLDAKNNVPPPPETITLGDELDSETVVYDFEKIKENLSKSGIPIEDELERGTTQAILPLKDTEGFHIVILAPGERVKPFLWPDNTDAITIGRDKTEVDICINDNRVSRVHLQIKRIDDDTIEVMDLGSTNHSYMKQDALKPYTPTHWEFGEMLVVGRTRLILRQGIPG